MHAEPNPQNKLFSTAMELMHDLNCFVTISNNSNPNETIIK